MNTLFGKYVLNGDPNIFEFLIANWPLVCEWAGIDDVPVMAVPAIGKQTVKLAGGDLYAFAPTAEGPTGVFLNVTALEEEFYTVYLDPTGNMFAFLWGLLVSVARSWMRHAGNLALDDFLGLRQVEHALSAYPEVNRQAYLGQLLAEGGPNPDDQTCAQYLAAIAVWWVSPVEEYDGASLAEIVRARAGSFDLTLRPPATLPPLK
jgi:hypothetical protein